MNGPSTWVDGVGGVLVLLLFVTFVCSICSKLSESEYEREKKRLCAREDFERENGGAK